MKQRIDLALFLSPSLPSRLFPHPQHSLLIRCRHTKATWRRWTPKSRWGRRGSSSRGACTRGRASLSSLAEVTLRWGLCWLAGRLTLCVYVCVCVCLPSCIRQGFNRAYSVLSPYLHLSNFYLYLCRVVAVTISSFSPIPNIYCFMWRTVLPIVFQTLTLPVLPWASPCLSSFFCHHHQVLFVYLLYPIYFIQCY